MRKINFQEVGMENFKGYIDPMVLPIKPGTITLIVGPNGVGKTSIFDCFPFSYYGITPRGARPDDVVNNRVKKNCHTWVKWLDGDVPYELHRYHKHSKHGNTVILSRDGTPYMKGHNEVRPEVERLLVPQKLFMNTLLFAQQVKTFFTDLPDSEQKEIFRKVMKLDDYVLFQKEASKRESELTGILQEVINEIKVSKSILEDSEIQILICSKQALDFESDKKKVLDQLDYQLKSFQEKLDKKKEIETKLSKVQLTTELELCNENLTKNRLKLSSINIESDQAKSSIEVKRDMKEAEFRESREKKKDLIRIEKETELKKLEEEHLIKKEDLTKKSSNLELRNVNLESQRREVMKEIISLEKQEKKFVDNVLEADVSTCPTCNQEIDQVVVGEIVELCGKIRSEIEELTKTEVGITDSMKEDQETLHEYTEEILKLQKEIDGHRIRISESYKEEVRAIEVGFQETVKKLNKLVEEEIKKITQDSQKTWGELKEESKELMTQKDDIEKKIIVLEECQKDISKISIDIEGVRKDLDNKKKEEFDSSQLKHHQKRKQDSEMNIELLLKKTADLGELKDILMFWKEGFSSAGIPSMLIDEAIPFMNNRVSHYLDRIGGRYSVSFDTLKATKAGEFRDKISVNLFDSVTWADKRVQFSGGQIRVVDIATILTLGNLQESIQGVEFNILLFDEIFDALDEQNAEYVSSLLTEIKKDKAIYIISHKNIEQIEADEVLQMY